MDIRFFPKIPRFISEKIRYLRPFLVKQEKTLIKIGLVLILLILIIFAGSDVYKNYQTRNKVLSERQKIVAEIEYWSRIKDQHKDYRDAYFKLALLHYQLKDFDSAKKNLEKVFELDPNFEKGKELEKLLN